MSTKFVTWKPVKNSEREAVRKHGAEWIVRSHFIDTDHLMIVPKGNPQADLRWIKPEQVLEQRWELEPL